MLWFPGGCLYSGLCSSFLAVVCTQGDVVVSLAVDCTQGDVVVSLAVDCTQGDVVVSLRLSVLRVM